MFLFSPSQKSIERFLPGTSINHYFFKETAMPKLLYFVLPAILFLNSCTKDEEEDIPSRAALITRTPWKMSAWQSTPSYPISSGTTTAYYDDILKYYSDVNSNCSGLHEFNFGKGTKDYEYQMGAFFYRKGRCSNSSVPQEGSWFIHDGNDGIYLYLRSAVNPSVYLYIFKVEEVSYERLTISYKAQISGSSAIYVFTQTFVPADN